MHAIGFEARADNFIYRLLQRVAMLSLHLGEKGEDFFNLPLFTLAFMFGIILSFFHGLSNLILKVVNRVVLNHLI